MYTSQLKRLASPVFVLVALAIAGPATAAVRPDDRGSLRGVGTTSGYQPVRPDDRSTVRGAGATEFTADVRPDDRAGIRGIAHTSGGGFTTGAYGAPPAISPAPPTAALDIVAGPAGSRSTGDPDLPGDSSVPFWPYETGALLGTSETFIDVRDDGSYFDPSIGQRVLPRLEA